MIIVFEGKKTDYCPLICFLVKVSTPTDGLLQIVFKQCYQQHYTDSSGHPENLEETLKERRKDLITWRKRASPLVSF